MSARGVYLDTSSVVKRYVEETGSRLTDLVYTRAEGGAHQIIISLWNIGEVIGVLDRYRERRLLDEDGVMKALKSFLGESEKMMRLGSLRIVPLEVDILTETYALVLRHHIYQADALQIATCRISGSSLLLSADKNLLIAARAEGLEALDVETDEEQITNRFR